MNRRMKLSITVGMVFFLTSSTQANAIFGSECSDPKKTHQTALNNYQLATKKYQAARVVFENKLKKIGQDCLKNTDAAIRNNPSVWNLYKPDRKVFCELLFLNASFSIQAEDPKKSYRRAMEVIVNYKKCFSTNQYLDAKQWIREN